MKTTNNLILIGFMGCGKTTVGRLLSEHLGWTLVDTDENIEREQGRTIREIFAEDGENAFRQIEKDSIFHISRRSNQVIATGGGVIKDPDNVKRLKENGTILYLQWEPESLYDHVRDDDTRPLLMPYTGEAKLNRIRELLTERTPMYEEAADVQIRCDGQSPETIAERIIERFFMKNS